MFTHILILKNPLSVCSDCGEIHKNTGSRKLKKNSKAKKAKKFLNSSQEFIWYSESGQNTFMYVQMNIHMMQRYSKNASLNYESEPKFLLLQKCNKTPW